MMEPNKAMVSKFRPSYKEFLYKSEYCLAWSVSQQSVCGLVEFCSKWICQSCQMDFSKLMQGFVKIYKWIKLFRNVFIVQNTGELNTLSSLNPFSSALCLPLVQMVGFRDTAPHYHKLHSMLLLILHCIIISFYK